MRDVPPTGVRLAPALKSRLTREASINGRTLHAEILYRLQQSLDQHSYSYTEGNNLPTHGPASAARDVSPGEQPLPDTERAMLNVFRRLPPEKQLALLSLFK